MELKVTDEHRWLQKLIGTWETPTDETGGTWIEKVEPVGEVFVLFDSRGAMPNGAPWRTLMTLGFDPNLGKFVGSFAGSMMTYHWVYEGSLDESGRVLTLYTEGPEWKNGEMRRFRDVIEYDGSDTRIFRAEMLEPDGTWNEIMRTEYVRKSS